MPPRSNLQVPETISGERSLGTPFTDLRAAARPVGTSASPTGLNIPDAPRENSLMQLGEAMARFNPILSQFLVRRAESVDRVDSAQAAADSLRVRKSYAEAVQLNLIPAGASRAYIESYNSTDLNSKGLQHANSLHEAYEKSGLRGSDSAQAMDSFLSEHASTYRQGVLMKDGVDLYTPLERANSKFDEIVEGNTRSLLSQHVQYRADERTKLGKEIASNNLGLLIDKHWDTDNPASYADTAQRMVASLEHPIRGAAQNGLTHREANQLMVDLVAAKMVETGDERMAQLTDFMTTSEGNTISKLPYARQQFKQAADSIMASKVRQADFVWKEQERQALEAGGFGPRRQGEMRAAEAKRQEDLWAHHDQMSKFSLDQAGRSDVSARKNLESETHVSAILTGLKAGQMDNPKVESALNWLRHNDGSKAMTMINWIANHKTETASFKDNADSDMYAANLRYEMSRNPIGFNSYNIISAAEKRLINPSKVGALLDDWDKARLHLDNPFLQNPQFERMINTVRNIAIKDDTDRFGPGAKRAQDAEDSLRKAAYFWIGQNKDGKYPDFIKDMSAQSEVIALDYSPEFAKEEARKQEQRVSPRAVPQKDTRSTFEKVAPVALGGKDKPQPVAPAPKGPKPLLPSEALSNMPEAARAKVRAMLEDPNTDEVELDAAITNSGLWAFMKSNGRSAIEFKQLKDALVQNRRK